MGELGSPSKQNYILYGKRVQDLLLEFLSVASQEKRRAGLASIDRTLKGYYYWNLGRKNK